MKFQKNPKTDSDFYTKCRKRSQRESLSFWLAQQVPDSIFRIRTSSVSVTIKLAHFLTFWGSKNFFREYKVFYRSFRTLSKKFQQVCQKSIWRLQRNILSIFLKNSHFFSSLSDFIRQILSNLWQKIFGKLVRMQSGCTRENFVKK